MVHEIGLELRSTAVCKGVRRTRDGCFTVQQALIRNQWTSEEIMNAVHQYHSIKTEKKGSQKIKKSRDAQKEEDISTSQNITNRREAVN